MKKILIAISVIVIIFLIWLGVVYIGLGNDASHINTNNNSQENNLTTEEIIKNKSEEVLFSINNKDIDKFKTLIHPTEGVRFSKDGVVSLESDKQFTVEQINNLIKKNEVILWGYADGSGFPINKTFTEYFSQYSKNNYLKAPRISYDKVLRGGANTISNIEEKYPNTHFMSYYYPYTSKYTNEKGEEVPQEMSWTTLNLVFEEYQDEYYLVGVVGDNWTI